MQKSCFQTLDFALYFVLHNVFSVISENIVPIGCSRGALSRQSGWLCSSLAESWSLLMDVLMDLFRVSWCFHYVFLFHPWQIGLGPSAGPLQGGCYGCFAGVGDHGGCGLPRWQPNTRINFRLRVIFSGIRSHFCVQAWSWSTCKNIREESCKVKSKADAQTV